MSKTIKFATGAALAALAMSASTAFADDIVVGFATAESGFMQAYDKPAQDAAMIRIGEINKAGGLLGKQIRWSRPIPRPTAPKAPRLASK